MAKKALIGIQARLESKRFPRKIVQDLCGKPIINHVVDRCNEAKKILLEHDIEAEVMILYPSNEPSPTTYCDLSQANISLMPGDPEDLIARYSQALNSRPDVSVLCRITADCPLVDAKLIVVAIAAVSRDDGYCSNTVIRTYPDGDDVQACSVLAWREFFSHQPQDREHPFYQFDSDPEVQKAFTDKGFKWRQLLSGPKAPLLKTSIDTRSDLESVKHLIKRGQWADDETTTLPH